MVNRFRSKTPTDVAYNGGNWLEEFAAAGWVVPLEDHFSWVRDYESKVQPFAWQDMTYDGKVYGLPYYADTITFMYNEKALTDAGISAPPQTWEEVTEQSLTLKAAGMEFPFVYEFANTLPNVSEAFASMVFGRGGELIDEQKNPLWTDPASPAALQLKWLVEAKNTHQILTIQPHEVDIANAMNTGQHAFTVMFNYNLAALNNAATSALAGQFKLGLMPGETHECYGFAKFYNMTQMAMERGQETIDAVGSFVQYFAGETADGQYPVAKRWAVEQGLGFGQTPLLEDQDVIDAYSKWVDMDVWREQLGLARARRQAVWYGIWSETFHPLLGRALNNEISADQALEDAATAWNDLKSRVEG
jgi:multiple sugar transport system substrate-binding protein